MKKQGWTLVNTETGIPVKCGCEYADSCGVKATLTGGEPPHKPSSTGRIYVTEDGRESQYFPSVFNMKWVKSEDKGEAPIRGYHLFMDNGDIEGEFRFNKLFATPMEAQRAGDRVNPAHGYRIVPVR